MVGTTNTLPLLPFDGGNIFRDGLDYTMSKVFRKMKERKRKRIAGRVSIGISITILVMIIWLVLGQG